jgi:hypothetical protein
MFFMKVGYFMSKYSAFIMAMPLARALHSKSAPGQYFCPARAVGFPLQSLSQKLSESEFTALSKLCSFINAVNSDSDN